MNDVEVREKVTKHYRDMAVRMPQYAPTRMAELAPGVVAVEDESGECDALFDTERCKFARPELWRDDIPAMLNGTGLNVLESASCSSPIRTVEAMVGFARDHLVPAVAWHEEPKFFNFKQ